MANQSNTPQSGAVILRSKLSIGKFFLNRLWDWLKFLGWVIVGVVAGVPILIQKVEIESIVGYILIFIIGVAGLMALDKIFDFFLKPIFELRAYVAITVNSIIFRQRIKKHTLFFDDIEQVYVSVTDQFVIVTRAYADRPSIKYAVEGLKNRWELYNAFWAISGREKPAENDVAEIFADSEESHT